MRYLRENTATRVSVGPFIDVTDGITPEIALTATNEALTLVVDDGGVPTLVLDAAATASAGSNDLVHITSDAAGMYDLELTAAQTNYTGRAFLSINYLTDHLPVFHEFQIIPATTFDLLYADASLADVDLIQSGVVDSGSTTTIVDAALTEADDYWNGKVLRITWASGETRDVLVTDFVASTDTLTFTPAQTAVAASDTYELRHCNAVDVVKYNNATAAALIESTDIAAAVLDAAKSSHTDAGTVGLAIGDVDTAAAAIQVITDALTAAAATQLALSAGQIITGTVDTVTNTHTPTTVEFQCDDITEATADHFNGRTVVFTSGVLVGQATDITDYAAVGGIGQFTVTALTEAPSNNDTCIIV